MSCRILVSFPILLSFPLLAADPRQPLSFSGSGYTALGTWSASGSLTPAALQPGGYADLTANLVITDAHLQALAAMGVQPNEFCVLATAERTFDADGWMRLPSDERMSTLLTPAGLPIEGGVQGAVTNRYSYDYRTPLDVLSGVSLTQMPHYNGVWNARILLGQKLPADMPPGIYRVRLDFGAVTGNRVYSLNGETFAVRPSFTGTEPVSHIYSPPIRVSGKHVSGREVDATRIQPRMYWVLLNNYNSNGCKGVVADEDAGHFAIAGRNLIQDDVILPLNDNSGRRLSYSLEPQFPTDTIDAAVNIPWDYTKGELSVTVTGPDGKSVDLGMAPFVGQSGGWPTTKQSAITAWKPAGYGYYTVTAKGWIADIWGNRYEGGGTYHFWIANRMTLATATFQGMSLPVGSTYGRDLGFAPPAPADVEVTATLYPYSDASQAKTATWGGKASAGGIYGSAQGAKTLLLDAPGEYATHIVARYADPQGQLWVCSMRHAGVVYPADSPIVARGKKVVINNQYLERGETNTEGYIDDKGVQYLQHINFPYNPGDVLLIASDGQGANKIEPTMIWEWKKNAQPYDTSIQGIGLTNLRITTPNRYSPHLFPEYVQDKSYYYGSAARPGFMGRFLVSESGARAPYWPTSPNSFGGQINASNNGDLPGDIYRLMGGVVLHPKGQQPMYAGYLASAFLLPQGTKNNRVIGAGAEDVIGPYGEMGRVFLVGTRPGMLYLTGTTFGPAVQIDPVLPANITFTLNYPDGRQVVSSGAGDATGSFAGTRSVLDVPGIYRYTLEGEWQGHKAVMPGLPPPGGELYVIEADRPADAPALGINLPMVSTFNPQLGLTITGSSTAATVRYAAVMPGSVLEQGEVPVNNGRFEYFFSPQAMNAKTSTYDIADRVTGKAAIGDVVHLTFFSEEKTASGAAYHSFARVILRGTTVVYTR
jgi:hypothetical protein